MARIKCSKGHVYDSAIYGDNCPFCPSGTGTSVNNNATVGTQGTPGTQANGTQVNGSTQVGGTAAAGPTIPMGGAAGGNAGGTVIRPAAGGNTGTPSGKRIVGLLVTYSTNPSGEVFNIYEGRNYVGRDAAADVRIQGDSQVSGKHFSIMYRVADGKFKFRDEQSSNGTFLNSVLTDEGELNTFDIIGIGATRLIFIAIPQIPQTTQNP